MTGSTNSELIRRGVHSAQMASAMLSDLSIASKLLDAAGRMKDLDRARQYFLIATSTYVEIAEAMNTSEVSETKQSAEIELALAALGQRLRDYRATLPVSSLAES